MSKHHYFFAIKLPKEAKNFLNEWMEAKKHEFPFAKWVHPEDYHITLAFLGFAPEDMISAAIQTMPQVLIGVPPFSLTLHQIGTFGPQKKPRIFWADVEHSTELIQLQKKVYNQALKVGFDLDKKPFRPHITLARKWNSVEEFDPNLLTDIEGDFSFTVNEIILYETHLDKTPKYHEFARFSLE